MASVPGLSDGMISPVICVVIAAASRSMFAASMTLKPAQGAVAPVSSIISCVNSPTLEASTSAALSSSARRSPGPVFDHAGKAACRGLDRRLDVGHAGRRRRASPACR